MELNVLNMQVKPNSLTRVTINFVYLKGQRSGCSFSGRMLNLIEYIPQQIGFIIFTTKTYFG